MVGWFVADVLSRLNQRNDADIPQTSDSTPNLRSTVSISQSETIYQKLLIHNYYNVLCVGVTEFTNTEENSHQREV